MTKPKKIGEIMPSAKKSITNNTKKLTKMNQHQIAFFDELFKKHADLILKEKTKKYDIQHEYILNSDNRAVFELIKSYFTKQPEFEKSDLISNESSLHKGLLIHGDYGIGKSLLFNIIQAVGSELMKKHGYPGIWFKSVSAGAFVENYMIEVVKKERNAFSNFDIRNYYKGVLYIDDLGFEKKAFNRDELFSELLFERNRQNSLTFVTTNLSPSEIGNRYGEIIGDRLFEMFNLIKWNGESFRK